MFKKERAAKLKGRLIRVGLMAKVYKIGHDFVFILLSKGVVKMLVFFSLKYFFVELIPDKK